MPEFNDVLQRLLVAHVLVGFVVVAAFAVLVYLWVWHMTRGRRYR